ncbi:MAG: hypothetical protein GQ559_10980 [Desulfobulbaceae bacterium]|nr:hypothetical protein [Desulfobulbaceae bacterium]
MRIIVFQQNNSGIQKIAGIGEYGRNMEIAEIISIDEALPKFVDDPETYISDDFDADIVLDYLTHPDLSHYLIGLCVEKKIPVVASGKKDVRALTPFTCCGLGRHKGLGGYGEQFGFPEYRLQLDGNRIAVLEVVRGAPCGATWDILPRIMGVEIEEAMSLLPREIQYLCSANPSGFDPVTGKSPVHYAGYVHRAALKKAIAEARKKTG